MLGITLPYLLATFISILPLLTTLLTTLFFQILEIKLPPIFFYPHFTSRGQTFIFSLGQPIPPPFHLPFSTMP
jgi:hypothetical protein